MSSKKSTPFFELHAWMVKTLNLKNYELLIYALIYSYSKNGNSAYQGSIEYICSRLGVSMSTVIRVLNDLVYSGYISKTTYFCSGKRYVEYRHSNELLQKRHITKSSESEGFSSSGFFTIYDWMITKYNLSGHMLTVFALIYSFTETTGSFKGNNSYIAARLNMSTKQVSRVISELVSLGLVYIIKQYDPSTRITVYSTNSNKDLGKKGIEEENQKFVEQYYRDMEKQLSEIKSYYDKNLSESDFQESEGGVSDVGKLLCMANSVNDEYDAVCHLIWEMSEYKI